MLFRTFTMWVWCDIKFMIKSFSSFSNKPWFLRVCSTSIVNTVGKGEIAHSEQFLLFQQCFLPVWRTGCNFHWTWNCLPLFYLFFFFSVWKSLKFVLWQSINPFPKKPWILRVWSASLLKTLWEKEKLLITSNFSFFHSVFYPLELYAIFIKIEIFVCKLFQFGRVQNLSFGKVLSLCFKFFFIIDS